MSTERECEWCRASLTGRRVDARFCGGACRAAASRARRVASSEGKDLGWVPLKKRTHEHIDAPQAILEGLSGVEVAHEPGTIYESQLGAIEVRDERGGAEKAFIPLLTLTVPQDVLHGLAEEVAELVATKVLAQLQQSEV